MTSAHGGPCASVYRVTFTADHTDDDAVSAVTVQAAGGDVLAACIHAHVQADQRRRWPGRPVHAIWVAVRRDLSGGHLHHLIGDNAGTFTIEQVPPSEATTSTAPGGEPVSYGARLSRPQVDALRAADGYTGDGTDLAWVAGSTRAWLSRNGLIASNDPWETHSSRRAWMITSKGGDALATGRLPLTGYAY